MRKWNLYIVMVFVMVSLVSGLELCEDYMDGNVSCKMQSPSLTCLNYTYEVINVSASLIENGSLVLDYSDLYYFNFSHGLGDYVVRLCDGTTREIYIGGKDRMVLAIIILIPLIFGLFMLIGAASLSSEHEVFRWFLFLLSPITVWVSFHFGMVSLVYTHGLPELQEAIGDTTYWMSWLFSVMLSYFLIYTIWKWANTVAQKKKEESELRY